MQKPGALFDYKRLQAKRLRAVRMARPGADFLVVHAATEICDRLAVTNRKFERALDLFSISPAMAERLQTSIPGIWLTRIGDDSRHSRDDLQLEPGRFDLIVSAFGLHWCNDLPGTLLQARRALKPDGLLMAALPGEGTLGQLRAALIGAETAITGGAAMRVDPFAEVRQAGALLQRAGFALPVADTEHLTVRYANCRALLGDLRSCGTTSVLTGAMRPLPRQIMAKIEEEYASQFSDSDGRLPATVNIVYLTGWAPHASQQQSLKPGTAKTRLADFLKP